MGDDLQQKYGAGVGVGDGVLSSNRAALQGLPPHRLPIRRRGQEHYAHVHRRFVTEQAQQVRTPTHPLSLHPVRYPRKRVPAHVCRVREC